MPSASGLPATAACAAAVKAALAVATRAVAVVSCVGWGVIMSMNRSSFFATCKPQKEPQSVPIHPALGQRFLKYDRIVLAYAFQPSQHFQFFGRVIAGAMTCTFGIPWGCYCYSRYFCYRCRIRLALGLGFSVIRSGTHADIRSRTA